MREFYIYAVSTRLKNISIALPFLIRTGISYYFNQKNSDVQLFERLGLKKDNYDQRIKKRISYYIFLNKMIIDAFAILRGKPLSKTEVELGMMIGAFTPVYDDLMDEQGLSHEEVEEGSDANNQLLNLYQALKSNIEKMHPDFDQFQLFFKAAGVAQNNSILLQRDSNTDLKKLREIMYVKGGNFCLLFRSGMDHTLGQKEMTAIYELGGMTQYVNDVFDVYKDYQQGTFTIPIKLIGKAALRQDYGDALESCRNAFYDTDFKKGNIDACWIRLRSLLTRAFVALDHYDSISEDQILEVDRSRLICDMEKASNLINNFRYTIQPDN